MPHDMRNGMILADGTGVAVPGTDLKSLHTVALKPQLRWVIDAVSAIGVQDIFVVTASMSATDVAKDCIILPYDERLKEGQSALNDKKVLFGSGGDTLVLYGDACFIDDKIIQAAYDQHIEENNDATAITAVVSYPAEDARIVRQDGVLYTLRQEEDCADEMLALPEADAGACWFKTERLMKAIDVLQPGWVLGDLVRIITDDGGLANRYLSTDPAILMRGDSAAELLEMNEMATAKIFKRHLDNGVLFTSRDGIVIGPDVVIEPGATILPGTLLTGKTVIGTGSVIGPNSQLTDTTVGKDTVINASKMTDSVVGDGVTFGPNSQLRPGCRLGNGVKVGNFVEIKNSTVGDGTSVAHLTYIGDADVGAHCNFGCGVVFVNYDGKGKYRTTVGDYAFIGCNTNLIAPVSIGEGAYTAAGTTVTEDVPDGALAIGRVRQRNKLNWGKKKLDAYIEKNK